MDQIFDRLGNLLKSFVRDDSGFFSEDENTSFSDPDLQDAWEELDDFLKTGDDSPPKRASASAPPKPAVPPELVKDYKNLEVAVGTPLPEIAKKYKLLLRKHHPDRHASDPAAFAKATEKTKLLTSSFRRIRQYVETGEVS